MRDRRRPAFAYQELAATALIRRHFDGSKLARALAIYQSMTEVANAARTRENFEAERTEIAALAGCSPDTVDRYVPAFVGLGLLEVERRMQGALNLPNLWTLLSPPSDGNGRSEGGRTRAATGGTRAGGGRTVKARGGRTGAAPVNQEEGVKEPPNPPKGGRARERKIFEDQLTDYVTWLLPAAEIDSAVPIVRGALGVIPAPATTDGVLDWLERWHPDLVAACPRRP